MNFFERVLAFSAIRFNDAELGGDEDLQIGTRVEICDGAGRIFAATVTDRVGDRWQLTILP
ncbi:MAG: hypothetical protein ACRDZX_04935 [Acidimicrobiales bacterium]